MNKEQHKGQKEQARQPKRTLEQGLTEIAWLPIVPNDGGQIGVPKRVLDPEGKTVTALTREDYLSQYQKNRRAQVMENGGGNFVLKPNQARPEHLNDVPDFLLRPDKRLYSITYSDGSSTFVVWEKDSSNPFAVMPFMTEQSIDMRNKQIWLYEFDGQETIIVTDPKGRQSEITGEHGKPDYSLLPTLRQALGTRVRRESFAAAKK